MTAATLTAGVLGTLVRVSVTAGERSVDLGAPGSVPVAELVPGLARTLNLLDPETVHGGFWLVRSDGVVIDSDRSLAAQGVADGAALTLQSGAKVAEVRVYDDIVEAVADAVEGEYAPWTLHDSALTAVFAAVAFLLTGAVLLVGADRGSLFPPVIATVGGLLVLGSGAVVGRVGRHEVGARALVLTACGYGLVAGLTAGSGPLTWGWPTAFGGLGMLAFALLGMPVLSAGREVCGAPGVLGLALAGVGLTVAVTGAKPGTVLAVVVAIVATAGNAIPWLALASAPLRVIPARSGAGIPLDPPVEDRAAIGEQQARGQRRQVALRGAAAVLTLVAASVVVATGVPGTLLLAASFVGMLLSVRQTYSRRNVLVVMCAGIVGLTATGVLAAAAHPQWRAGLALGAGVAAAGVIVLSLVAPRRRLAMGRMADFIELICLATLLPLGAAAAGLV